VEQAIAARGLGVSASVPCPTGVLSFARVGKQWKLVVVNQENTTPLVNTSRETRCSAVDLIPSLVEKLAEEVGASTRVVTDALERTKEIVHVLKTRPGT
jgi:hypothetical protein